MAAQDSTQVPSLPQVRELGFVREIIALAQDAGARAEVQLDDTGRGFSVALTANNDTLADRAFGGLPLRWELPAAIDAVFHGRIEKITLPDRRGSVDRVSYWGAMQDLVDARIAPRAHVQRGRHWTKGNGSNDGRAWRAYFAPSGRVLYSVSRDCSETFERARALGQLIDAGELIGVTREDLRWCTQWVGSKEDLIATGVCTARHFPDGRKRTCAGDADGRPAVDSWYTEALRRGHYRHTVRWDGEASKAAEDLGAQEPSASADAQDPAAFAEACEDAMMDSADAIIDMIGGAANDDQGPRYDRRTVEQVRDALDHARQLLQAATPARPRAAVRRQQHTRDAAADDAFQAFIAATLAAPRPSPRKGSRP